MSTFKKRPKKRVKGLTSFGQTCLINGHVTVLLCHYTTHIRRAFPYLLCYSFLLFYFIVFGLEPPFIRKRHVYYYVHKVQRFTQAHSPRQGNDVRVGFFSFLKCSGTLT